MCLISQMVSLHVYYTALYFSLINLICFQCGMKFIVHILTNIVEFIVDVCIQVYRNESKATFPSVLPVNF